MNTTFKEWGGSWTEEKLDTFTKYVEAYLTIMNNNRDTYNWKLIYFDGFAGSGTRLDYVKKESLLNDLFNNNEIDFDEINLYQGAAERILSIEQRGFDYNYFIDMDKHASEQLKEHLHIYEKPETKLIFRCSDANTEIKKLATALKDNCKLKALVLLDPFGMQVNWNSINELKGTNTDLWILIPTGVIVNRLLDKNGKLNHCNTLCSFFGISEDEIREYFYKKQVIQTLFGTEERIIKINQPIKKIAELYIKQLSTIFEYVTEKPLIMYNRKNVPIFHFAFASNNRTATKIASQIIIKKKRIK